jgi:uroporphyrinogen decarboxylase
MKTHPGFAEAIIDRTTEMSCHMATSFAKNGIDVIVYGEDIATQRGLVMSPEMWREWLKPRLERVIKAAHHARPDVLFMYHSDGDVTEVIPELIEIGIDILNPLQPECMDVARIKEEYGSEIALWGASACSRPSLLALPKMSGAR